MQRVSGVISTDDDTVHDEVEVDVFGSTVLRVGGCVVDLGRRQVRQVVSLLVAGRGWTVSADSLIDHLWPDELPQNPRKALHVVLSRLRTALGPCADRLVADGHGYRLVTDRVDIDVFVALVESCRDLAGRASADLLGRALETWSGEPFADDVDAPLLTAQRAHVHELRWFAITRRTELLVELGEPELAVGLSTPSADLEEEVIRERFVVARARALALSGRKSEALSVTGRAIKMLRSERGIDPSQALLDVEREILAGSVELASVAFTRHRPAGDVFVGRHDELMMLAAIEPGRPICVVAEAGMGKSSLLDRFTEDRGAAVVRVDVSQTPDRPLDTIARLCVQLSRSGPSTRPPIAAEFSGALGRLCPELGSSSAVALTRDAMVDDLVRFVEVTAADRIVVIDDAHWLDGGSMEIVEQLVARGRLALVVAMRPSDNPRLAFLQDGDAAGPAAPQRRCQAMTLHPLDRAAVLDLVSVVSDRAVDDAAVEELAERSGGNALYLRLMLDEWSGGGGLDGDLPSSILVAVRERLDVLSQQVLDTLDVASALGQKFSLHQLRQHRPNADGDLAAATAAGIVTVDLRPDTATFVHALVSDVCYQLLASGRRVSIHDEIGRALEVGGAPAAEYARHHVAASALDPNRAVWSSLLAAGEFVTGFDWQTAREHIERAGSVAEQHGLDDPSLLAHIATRRGTVRRVLLERGYVDDLLGACDLARAAGESELFVVAVTELCGHGLTTAAATTNERVLPLLDEALRLAVEPRVRAELCAASVPLFSTSNDFDRGRHLYHEAWDLACRSGDVEVEAAVLAHASLGFSHPADFELLVEASNRLAALAGSDAEMIWEAAFIGFQCATIVGDVAVACEAIDRMRLYTPMVTRRPRDFGLAFSESAHAALLGDLDAADAFAADALAIGLERFDPSWATTIYGLLLTGIREQQGRLGELADVARTMIEARPDYLPFRAIASMIAAHDGDVTSARTHLDPVAIDGFAHLVQDLHFTSVVKALAPAVAIVGTDDEAEALWNLLLPFAGRMSWNGVSSNGPIDAALAMLASARGDDDLADRYSASADALIALFRSPTATPGTEDLTVTEGLTVAN